MGVGASRSLRMTVGFGASRFLRMTVWYFALRSEPCGEAFTLRCALLKARDLSSAKRTQDDGEGRCFAFAQDDGVALCAPLRMTVRPQRLPERSGGGPGVHPARPTCIYSLFNGAHKTCFFFVPSFAESSSMVPNSMQNAKQW